MLGEKHLVRRSLEWAMATDKEFTLSDIRVYMFIASCVDRDYKFSATQGAIAEQMGISRPSVNVSIKSLQEKDLIREAVDENGIRTYYLNPYYIRSENKKHTEELIEIYEAIPPRIPHDLDFMQQCEKIAQKS